MSRQHDRRGAIDDALGALAAIAGSDRSRRSSGRRRRRWWAVVLAWLTPPLVFALLPFLVLLRGATLSYETTALPIWLCLVVAVVASGTVVFVSTAWLVRRLGVSLPRYLIRLSMVLSVAYCGFALLYVSAENVKRPEIRETYAALHPLLRLSVSTLVLFDSRQVVTDSERVPEEYGRMGLAENPASLHYRQDDGYVHAIDLRTIGRSGAAVMLTRWYFVGMGFDVLRHTGTADHLHVSLSGR